MKEVAAVTILAVFGGSTASATPGEVPGLQSVPPVVVQTVPQAGQSNVDPSITEIRVTFSKRMVDGGWSWTQISRETFPETTGKPRYLADGKTCVLPVKLEPGRVYGTWLNSKKFTGFKDRQGQSAVPYLLVFETATEKGGADDGKQTFKEVAQTGNKTPEDLARVVIECLKRQDLPALVKQTVFSDDDAEVMISRIRKAFSKEGRPLGPDDYPPPFFRGRWSSDAEDILEDWQRFVERGRRDYGIDWTKIDLECINCKIRKTGGIVGASGITVVFSSGSDHYQMFIDDCYLTDRGWLAADGPMWKGQVAKGDGDRQDSNL